MTAPFIAIVADDLTGSGDTAVQFVRVGWQTQLSVGRAAQALADPCAAQAEVIAVTTHSRALDALEAARVVGEDVSALRAAGVKRLYKKVDSTLRGPFLAEINAARRAWREDAIAVVCPAFPATGRSLKNGVLYVDGRPVTETSAATDPVTPVTESHVPTLLGSAHVPQRADEAADELAARILAAGDIVVVDAETPEDMERLACAIAWLGERALPVGSGGLAAPLARIWARSEHQGAVVVVVTSQHSCAREQARGLVEKGARVWGPEPEQLAHPERWAAYMDQALTKAQGEPPQGTWLLLAPEGAHPGLDSDAVATRLGELAARMVLECRAAGVVATGGDGASAVLDALGAGGIALVDEVTGGMPLGTLTGGPAAGLPVVTKAGGFGTPDVLTRAVTAVRERRFSA
ncbi:MAG TPA: four-carbon acid sugar kinase family protein [Burkholderiaceae bacterium]|nr:four-carbon acid sugar kinase family protein [Burkholderiaceae bacterium]